MTTFFKQSRLHHIGTWRNRIEALMAEVEASAPNPAPYAKGGHSGGFLLALCGWVNWEAATGHLAATGSWG